MQITKNEPARDAARMRLLLYGDGKIGKSTLVSGIDNVVFLDFDGALRHLPVSSTPHLTSWALARDAYAAVEDAVKNGDGPQTVVVDTITFLRDQCIQEVERKGGAPISSIKNGWSEVNNMIERMILAYYNLGLGVVLIAHAQQSEREQPGGRSVVYNEPSLSPRLGMWINGWVDFALYMRTRNVQGGEGRVEHLVHTRPGPSHYAGGRYLTPPPREIIIPPPPENGWATLSAELTKAMTPPEAPTELV